MSPTPWWQPLLAIAVIGIVLALRLRNVKRARRMRLGRLLVAPLLLLGFTAWLFATSPPAIVGLAAFAGALLLGAAVGWQRARWTKVTYDAASGSFALQQSPLAVVLLVAVIALRRLLFYGEGGAAMLHSLWLVDALIGFGLGMVSAQNAELYARARALRRRALAETFA